MTTPDAHWEMADTLVVLSGLNAAQAAKRFARDSLQKGDLSRTFYWRKVALYANRLQRRRQAVIDTAASVADERAVPPTPLRALRSDAQAAAASELVSAA